MGLNPIFPWFMFLWKIAHLNGWSSNLRKAKSKHFFEYVHMVKLEMNQPLRQLHETKDLLKFPPFLFERFTALVVGISIS
jgi:hypothetical protein